MTSVTDAESLFAQYADRVRRYLARALGEREAARDLTQEGFLRVSRTAIPAAPDGQLAGWLFRIARNVALDHDRQRSRRPETDLSDAAERMGDAPQEMALALKQALAALPDLDRDVFLLREVGGLSRNEIATAYPEPHKDRRLVAIDLWLVERLPDGKERSQPLSLRGLYHQKIPFYFDTVTEGDKTLDVFGDLQIAPGAEITMTTRSRVNDPARAFDSIATVHCPSVTGGKRVSLADTRWTYSSTWPAAD